MTEIKPRPVIFLYTEAAQIADDVRAGMIEAGYLPVLVADVNEVKILTAPLAVEATDLSAITVAALDAIVKSSGSTMSWASHFGARVASELLATSARKTLE
jgi:hypothetical protein